MSSKEDKSLFSYIKRERWNEIVGVLLILLSLLTGVALITYSYSEPNLNWIGPAGNFLASVLLSEFGFSSFLIPFLMFWWGWNRFRNHSISKMLANSILFLGIMISIILYLSIPDFSWLSFSVGYQVGGSFGKILSGWLLSSFSTFGALLLTSGFLIIVLLVTTEINFQHLVSRSLRGIERLPYFLSKKEKSKRETKKAVKSEVLRSESKQVEHRVKEKELKSKKIDSLGLAQTAVISEPELDENYKEAFLECLYDLDEEKAKRVDNEDKSNILTLKLSEFGVKGIVTGRFPGPVITRYEFEPAPGVKVSSVFNLADDLALALRARAIRILGPIPGKGALGIEIPNEKRAIVGLKGVLTSSEFEEVDSPLVFALGRDITGKPAVADLREMPHLLVAGATGSGKSVCLNSIITSILYRSHPSDVHFILIDPKRIELSLYRGIPHLKMKLLESDRQVVSTSASSVGGERNVEITQEIEGIVVDPQGALKVFRMAVELMDERYRLFANVGARNIEDYNRREEKKLSYLVIVIDELADLMLAREASEIEAKIAKLAQMSRAVGIHLIVATQRPSVDVLTGVIKANFPSRIAFQVASKTDSRTILDANGAEALLGKGDMLFLPPGSSEIVRLHGTFISTEETQEIVEFVKSWFGVEEEDMKKEEDFSLEVVISKEEKEKERDPLFEEAKRLVIQHQQGSTSLLQRRLRIGYQRAARLIDQLEEAGIVGPFDGSKARDVLIRDE